MPTIDRIVAHIAADGTPTGCSYLEPRLSPRPPRRSWTPWSPVAAITRPGTIREGIPAHRGISRERETRGRACDRRAVGAILAGDGGPAARDREVPTMGFLDRFRGRKARGRDEHGP